MIATDWSTRVLHVFVRARKRVHATVVPPGRIDILLVEQGPRSAAVVAGDCVQEKFVQKPNLVTMWTMIAMD
jgi:hypothetical protein